MSLAARIRLGLPVDDFLPKKCSCGRNIEKDVSHFLCCSQSGPHSATIKRHDKVVQLLAGYFRKAGAVARVEQRIFDVERSRPDLEIISTKGSYLIDVALTVPFAPSRAKLKLVPLRAAQAGEREKQRKYGDFAAARGEVCYGFAIETFGAWGKEAVKVMQLLESMMLEQRGSGVTRLRMIQTISIAVQAWNAEVCKSGITNTLNAARS